MTRFRFGILLAIVMATSLAPVICLSVAEERSSKPPRGGLRMREGTRLSDVAGKFEVAGDRVSFAIADSTDTLRVLENLSLERVARILSETRTSQRWVVSGTITEYNGINYFLLSKAVQTGQMTDVSRKSSVAQPGGIGTTPAVDYSGPKEIKPGTQP